ncbi:hypothetical protein [Paenibacillus xylanexedens]|uniref:hypothetical protein n=1 Tax=Paenibacillus xylanexedens TaxID=528191 RepID=UPI00119D0CBA|nr:hypothetical protein [Paenibacillus xylanexedens]
MSWGIVGLGCCGTSCFGGRVKIKIIGKGEGGKNRGVMMDLWMGYVGSRMKDDVSESVDMIIREVCRR